MQKINIVIPMAGAGSRFTNAGYSKQGDSDFFKATCGGMGLTGVILNATIKMIRV